MTILHESYSYNIKVKLYSYYFMVDGYQFII